MSGVDRDGSDTVSASSPRPIASSSRPEPALPSATGSAGKATGPFVWGQDGANRMLLPQLWLPASLDFFLEKPRMWFTLAPLEMASDRLLSLRLAGTLCGVRLICLTGALAWGAGWGPLPSRKWLCSDKQLGFPARAWLLAQSNFPAQGLPGRRLLSAFRLRQLGLGRHSGSEDTQPHLPASMEGALGTFKDRRPELQAGEAFLLPAGPSVQPGVSLGKSFVPSELLFLCFS